MADIQIGTKADTPADKLNVNLNVSTQQARKSGSSTGPKGGFWWGTKKKKSAVARVRIKTGDGKLVVNRS